MLRKGSYAADVKPGLLPRSCAVLASIDPLLGGAIQPFRIVPVDEDSLYKDRSHPVGPFVPCRSAVGRFVHTVGSGTIQGLCGPGINRNGQHFRDAPSRRDLPRLSPISTLMDAIARRDTENVP